MATLAKLAILLYPGRMATDLPVAGARDQFSDLVNRANFAGEITYITRGRNRVRAAAVVPAHYAELVELLIDQHDGAIATERLQQILEQRSTGVPMSEVRRRLGM